MSFSHDALVKRIFSNPENARGLLAAALPPALSQRIDWTALALEPGSFVDDELKGRHTDLLFSARIGTSDALLYLLLEHQSSEDPLMAFRLLRYMVRIWDRWLEQHVGARTLPPIIPLVLHHSDRPWRAPTHLEALIDLTPEDWQIVAEWIPRYQFRVDDLTEAQDADLRARSSSVFAELGLRMLQRGRYSPDFLAEMRGWLGLFQKLARAPNGVAALAVLFAYALEVTDSKTQEIRAFAHQLGQAGDEGFMTGAQQLREEGRAEGRVEGRLEGRAEVVSRQLTRKYGPLPAEVQSRLARADAAELDRIADNLLTAATLDEALS